MGFFSLKCSCWNFKHVWHLFTVDFKCISHMINLCLTFQKVINVFGWDVGSAGRAVFKLPHFTIIDILPRPVEAGLIHPKAVENCAEDYLYGTFSTYDALRVWAHNNYSDTHFHSSDVWADRFCWVYAEICFILAEMLTARPPQCQLSHPLQKLLFALFILRCYSNSRSICQYFSFSKPCMYKVGRF